MKHNSIKDNIFVDFIGSGFQHDNFLIGTGDNQIQRAQCLLLVGWVENKFVFNPADTDAANRAVPF